MVRMFWSSVIENKSSANISGGFQQPCVISLLSFPCFDKPCTITSTHGKDCNVHATYSTRTPCRWGLLIYGFLSPVGSVLSGKNIAKLFRGNSFLLSAISCHRKDVFPLADIVVLRQLSGWAKVHIQSRKKNRRMSKFMSSLYNCHLLPIAYLYLPLGGLFQGD